MRAKLAILGVILVALVFVGTASLYTVDETEQALVLQFGEPVRTVQEPGLKFKLPFVQQVVIYEDRILPVDPPVEQVILSDQRRLDVDSYLRYRIVDPLAFYQAVRTEDAARARLSTIANAALRRVLGAVTQSEVLSEDRAAIMEAISKQVEAETQRLGVEIVDVRIVRADVPEGTVQSVFERMRSDRAREAAEFRARGFELAQQIRSRADRERTVLLAEADRDAQILRGEGDAVANSILGQAYSSDPSFFEFYRTLQAYRASLAGQGTTFVLSPDRDFFHYLDAASAPLTVGPPSPDYQPGRPVQSLSDLPPLPEIDESILNALPGELPPLLGPDDGAEPPALLEPEVPLPEDAAPAGDAAPAEDETPPAEPPAVDEPVPADG